MRMLSYLWRHPRRTGFLVFNVAAIALALAWGRFTEHMMHQGVAGVPNIVLGYTGVVLLLTALVVGWIAWAVMVGLRHAPRPVPVRVQRQFPADDRQAWG